MKKSIEKPFLIMVMILSIFIALLHFIRLSLGWDLILNQWNVPTLLSGVIIVVGVFIAYWSWIIINYEDYQKKEDKENQIEEEIEVTER